MLLINQAKAMNKASNVMYKNALEQLDLQHEATTNALAELGEARMDAYDLHVRRFVAAFERIKHVETLGVDGSETHEGEAAPGVEIGKIDFTAVDVAKTAITAAGVGTAAGTAAFVTVGALGTATTGTSIGVLTGAAATNATLAWLGGGSLAAGGAGMAGGAMVLGGIVVAPALIAAGFLIHMKGKKDLERAKANRAEAVAAINVVDAMVTLAKGIESRAKQLTAVIERLAEQVDRINGWLEALVEMHGDYAKMPQESKERLYLATTLVLTLRKALDVVLINEDGTLTKESRIILGEVRRFINAHEADSKQMRVGSQA